MTFKNRRGEVPWYVIGLILAVIVLLVSIGAILKLRDAQNQAQDNTKNACTVAGGKCQTACSAGSTHNPLGDASCAAATPNTICCF